MNDVVHCKVARLFFQSRNQEQGKEPDVSMELKMHINTLSIVSDEDINYKLNKAFQSSYDPNIDNACLYTFNKNICSSKIKRV